MRLIRVLIPNLFCLLVAISYPVSAAAEKVVLQLPWYPQFQFAGYYAAEYQGFFAEAGIDVEIRAGVDKAGAIINPVEEVVFQHAQFGVTRSDLLLHHARGLPVVMLATIMQRTPVVFITLDTYGFSKLEDIGTRPVSLPFIAGNPGTLIDMEIVTALASTDIDIETLNNRPANWGLQDLQEGKTQMILGYASDEPYVLERRGFKPVVISPMDYGIDLYGDLLFTSESTLGKQPDLVAAFRKAVLRGWEYALQYPKNTARYILLNYPVRNADYDLDFMLNEAQILRHYIQPDLIELGYSNRERWQRIAAVFREVGLIDSVDLATFIYTPENDTVAYTWLWVAGIVMMIFMTLLGWLIWTQLHLARIIRHGEKRESHLRRQAETDPLTGLVNRRRLSIELDVCYLRARQEGRPVSMLMLDIDHFKQVNDKYGHLAGDKVLQSLARLCRKVTRDSDIVCRYGGEEFAVLLPDTSLEEAKDIAGRLLAEVRHERIEWENGTLEYTISIGVTELHSEDNEGTDLLRRTDRYLYRAKAEGRDTLFADIPKPLTLIKGV